MLDAVKRYATRVLLLHLALLILVIFFVVGASREVQLSAREEAQTQSKERLALLADQTARGLESHYASILSDLEVTLRPEPTTAPASAPTVTPQTLPAPTTSRSATTSRSPYPRSLAGMGRGADYSGFGRNRGRGGRGGQNPPGTGFGYPGSNPFSLNLNAVRVDELRLLSRQLGVNSSNPSTVRASQIFLVDIGAERVLRAANTPYAYPEGSENSANTLIQENLAWIKTVKGVEMSSFKTTGTASAELTGYHLIAIPANVSPGGPGPFGGPGGPGGPPGGPGFGPPPPPPGPGSPAAGPASTSPAQYAIIVVVPMNIARDQFIAPLNTQEHEVHAVLVNDKSQVLATSADDAPDALGSNLLEQMDSYARDKIQPLIKDANAPPVILDRAYSVGQQTLAPQIFAAAQLEVPSGRHWTVLISSPLSEADALVNRVFGAASAWAIFLSLSVTAILVSTSVFMIRTRVRLERTRHEVLTRELEQARHIQLAWLPDLKSVPPGLEVSAANLPASHISGDFYNWFPLPRPASQPGASETIHDDRPPSKVAIVIGDVTGHGMAAAFLMATTQLLVRMTLSRYQDAGRCLLEVNRQLCTQGFQGQFVTMLVIVLDLESNSMEIATAGHPTPLVERNGTFTSLEMEPQLVLGVDPKETYKSQSFILEPGASVVLYTDGVVEAQNESGQQYGVQNLIKLLESQRRTQSSDVEPAQRIHAILDDVKRFSRTRELLDDVTLVAIRTTPAPVASAVSNMSK